MRLGGAYVTAMRGRDEDRATWVSSLTNEEPLVIVKACVDIMREVVRDDGGDGRDGMVWKRETPLCRSGRRGVCQRVVSTEDRDVSRDGNIGGHRGSEVFVTRRSGEYVVGVDGNVLVEWGEKESVEYFLSYAGRSGRHGR